EYVGLVERRQELLAEMLRPRVAVGLEHRDDPAIEPGLGSGQGGADLRGVMAIVVHHEDTGSFALDLEATLHAREAGERLLDTLEWHLEVEADPDGGQGVEHVVAARDLDADLTQDLAPVEHLELRLPAGVGDAPPPP